MVVIKSKKSKKQRGHRTHGWGAGKKHRGKGHKGGSGKSNVGKRGGSRKSKYLAKGEKPYGKQGTRKGMSKKFKVIKKTINLYDISTNLDSWVSKGLVAKKGSAFEIDLTKLGYQKLLAKGNIKEKINVSVVEFSAKAKDKIESAGGKVLSEEPKEAEVLEEPKAEA